MDFLGGNGLQHFYQPPNRADVAGKTDISNAGSSAAPLVALRSLADDVAPNSGPTIKKMLYSLGGSDFNHAV